MENSLTTAERLSDQSISIYYDHLHNVDVVSSTIVKCYQNPYIYYNLQHETTTSNLPPFLVFLAIFLSRWYSFFAILSFFAVFLFSYWSSYGSKVMKMYSISIYPPVISSTSKLKAKRCWIEWFSCLCGKGCMEVAHRFIY